jgi:uncharacterized protein YecE (DUF72 family)
MGMQWHLGTMGFSYRDWAQVFYPREIKSSDYLEFFATHFNAVELDTTFHAIPDRQRVKNWALSVHEDFRFSAKMPAEVTHETDFGLGRDGALIEFLDVIRELDEKLAVILLQFPPSLRSPQGSHFRKLLKSLPRDMKFAIEFRHSSWFDHAEATASLLRDHHIAWASADYSREPLAIIPTAPFLYIRWIGRHRQFPQMDHEQIDVTDRLNWWQKEIDRVVQSSNGQIRDVFGFFNNDYAGYAVATCNQFKQLVGEPVVPVTDPRQGRLF